MKLTLIGFVVLAIAGAVYVFANRNQHTIEVGSVAPAFHLNDAHGTHHQLADYKGKWVVLYFYPKDDTPGCTKEACQFRDDLAKLTQLGAQVLGVSVDDSASHAKFAEKYHLPFPLLADVDGLVAEQYNSLMKLGIAKVAKRHTFLINPNGIIQKVYTSVDTQQHSNEIIADLVALQGA